MHSIYATTTTRIWGTRNAWSAERTGGPDQPNTECTVQLEIQGDDRNGYNLVMSPEGFFTADSWHPTKNDAIDAACEIFGVSETSWSNSLATTGDTRSDKHQRRHGDR